MKSVLSLLTGFALIASMSSCTTYVEERGHSSRGYRSNSNYHSSNYRDSSRRSHDRGRDHDHRSSTRVRTNVHAPLGISSGVGVDIR